MAPKTTSTCAILSLFMATGASHADEAAEQMVQEALPFMYHTCTSVIEESDGDDTYVLGVVEKLTAVSLYNRQADVTSIATTEESQAKLNEDFLAALSEGCAGDEDALLAGVVDGAVKSALGL